MTEAMTDNSSMDSKHDHYKLASATRTLASALHRYGERGQHEAELARLYLELLASEHGDPFVREHPGAHFTGSALVLSSDGQRTLLTHHRKLDRWLQPGGHADGDRDLAQVALREAQEETGLPDLCLIDTVDPFDLDRHWIPERPGEPGHWHYDVRYRVQAGADERFQVSPESKALAWWPLAEVASGASFDPSLRRMAKASLRRT